MQNRPGPICRFAHALLFCFLFWSTVAPARANPADDFIAATWGSYGVSYPPNNALDEGQANCDPSISGSLQIAVELCIQQHFGYSTDPFTYDYGLTSPQVFMGVSTSYIPPSQTEFDRIVSLSQTAPANTVFSNIFTPECGVASGPTLIYGPVLTCELIQIPSITQPKLWLDVTTSGSSLSGQPTNINATVTVSPTQPDKNSQLITTLPNANDTTIQQAAKDLGYSGFDWMQNIAYPLSGNYECQTSACITTTPVLSEPSPGINDPPQYGWDYCNQFSRQYFSPANDCSATYPYYYPSNVASSYPANYCVTYNESGDSCALTFLSNNGTVLNFFDAPTDSCLNGPLGLPGVAYLTSSTLQARCGNMTVNGVESFTTELVGIGLGDTPDTPAYTVLPNGTFSWTDSFNGGQFGTGGISNPVVSEIDIPVDPTTGTGGITLVDTPVNEVAEPSSILIISTPLIMLLFFVYKRHIYYLSIIWHGQNALSVFD